MVSPRFMFSFITLFNNECIRLYHAFDSPRTNDGRGTSFGRIYNQQGVLVATCSQEGIIRLTKGEQARRQKAADEADASPSKL